MSNPTRPKRKRKPAAPESEATTTLSNSPLLLLVELFGTIAFMFLAELFLPAMMHRYLGINATLAPFIVYGAFGVILGLLLYRYPKTGTKHKSE